MKNTSEIKIAIFVISGLLLLIVGWAFIREVTLHEQTRFQVLYENVAGLSRGSFINVSGLKVGRVDGLKLNTRKKQITVDVRIQLPDIDIPKDSKFVIRTSGYVGDKFLDIELGQSQDYVMTGDVLIGEVVVDSFKSFDKLSEVINKLDTEKLGMSIESLAATDVKETLSNTSRAASKIADASDDVSTALNQRYIFPKLFFGKLIHKKQKN